MDVTRFMIIFGIILGISRIMSMLFWLKSLRSFFPRSQHVDIALTGTKHFGGRNGLVESPVSLISGQLVCKGLGKS